MSITTVLGEMSGGQNLVSNGFAYDDPRGDLLIWVTIGGRRETPSWPSISVVNLTLVVTTYQKDCQKPAPGFLRCASGRRCIWKHYFCDQHFNCPKDLIPADEDGCTYKEEGSEHTTLSPGSGGMNHDDSLNAVSLTLIIVASALVLLLTLILLVRYRRIRKCCASVSASTNSSCELPEQHQPRSLAELNRQRHMRETESNIYLPLTTFLDQPMQQESQQQHQVQHPQLPAYSQGDPHPHLQQERQQATMEVGRGLPPPEEPPPAYDDLFPAENHTQTLPEIRVLDRSSSSPARRSAEPDVVQRERGVDEMAERDNLREQGTSSDSDDNAGEATSAIAATTPAHTS